MILSIESAKILESNHYLLPSADMIKKCQYSIIPSIFNWPDNLENTWPTAHQVTGRSFLGNPENQWVFINGDTSLLTVLPEYNS